MNVGTLQYNTKSEQGEIKFSPTFEGTLETIQIDILSDWIYILTEKYETLTKGE